MSDSLYLTLYPLQILKGWERRLAPAVKMLGYRWYARGRVWRECDRKKCRQGLEFVDGFTVSPVRLAPRRHAVAINPHRFFFEDGADGPSDKPAWHLFQEAATPNPLSMSQTIARITKFHKSLADFGEVLSAQPVDIVKSQEGLGRQTWRLFGVAHQKYPLTASPGSALSTVGAEAVPNGLEFRVCTFHDKPKALEQYAQQLADACRRIHVAATLKIMTPEDAPLIVTAESEKKLGGRRDLAILLGVRGRKGEKLSDPELSYLSNLDKMRIPYRLFSLDNQALKWSAFDQAGILLESAGGSAYSIHLPDIKPGPPLVFVGLDLGHPRHSRRSWVVATLVDERGHLIGYWRDSQIRDETIRNESITAALNWIYLTLRKKFAGEYRGLILRDGRMFRHESIEAYAPFFRHDFSFVEVIKHPVPLMLSENGCAPEGSLCVPKDSECFFLLTSRSRNQSQINLPLKIHPVYDGLSLGRDRLAQLIVGLCYAPTLGLSHTRSPAPIYWANGIAAIGETNHQFSGLHHVPHN